MSNLYRGPAIDAFYQVSFHLAKWLKKRRFLEIDQSETRIACGSHVFLMNRDKISILYREPYKDAAYQVSIHLAKRFQRRIYFRNQPIRNKNGLWQPCFLMNRDKISILYRGPYKDAAYQVSIHLAKRFQRRIYFRNQPIRNKNGLWRPCLLTDRDKISNLYRRPAIDAFYQVSVHLAKRFQRRRFV
jgi:hypothetical protein